MWHPPVGFAHRGARAHAPDNTIEAFELAVRLGATGLETDVFLTADGTVVLDHDGVVRRGLRRRPVAELDRAELPDHVPTIAELWDAVGTGLPLSVDLKDPAAFEPLVAAARSRDVVDRLWACHPDLEVLVGWRRDHPDVHLVHSTSLERLPLGPERHASDLARERVDAVNLRRQEWSGGMTTLYHRFGVLCFGWDAQHDHHLDELIDLGVDAVYSDHVDRMMEAIARFS